MPSYPRFSRHKRARLVDDARRTPVADPAVEYPDAYLVHAHFLPGGYLSRVGAALYDRGIRPMYNLFRAGAVERKLARLISTRHPGGTLLDIGCGGGALLAATAGQGGGLRLTGVDLSPRLLVRAAKRLRPFPGVRLVHAKADQLPFEDGAFDAVSMMHVAGHLPDESIDAVMAEALRVLTPGGRLYLVEHRWHDLPFQRFGLARRRAIARTPLELVVLEPQVVAPESTVCDTAGP